MEAQAGLFSPIIGDVLVFFSLVVGVLAMITAAYAYTAVHQKDKELGKIEGMEREIRQLKRTIEQMKDGSFDIPMKDKSKRMAKPVPAEKAEKEETKGKPALGPKEAEPVWKHFVEDYNSLSSSMTAPRAEEACKGFVDSYQLRQLRCTNHAGKDSVSGEPAPQFELAPFSISAFWAWEIPDDKGHFVVVPNPLRAYGEREHEEGGMKETFASNYEADKTYSEMLVKLPALFRKDSQGWHIEQPGVIRLKEA